MTDARELLALAESTAHAAGELLMRARLGTIEVADTKTSPTDVVTAADLASEQLIRDRVSAARPDDAFIGEEGDDIAGSSGVTWLADPIDGTVNYLYGIPQFSVSIAAQHDGVTIAGVVHNPVSGETFTAVRGGGARLDGAAITVSRQTDVAQTLVGTGFGYRADVRRHQVAETAALLPTVRDIRRLGSAALDLCNVACGRLDAYVERGLKPWDLAAGRLVVTEAGGRVEGINGAEPGELLVVAAPVDLFDTFHAALVQSGFAEWPMTDWP
ncbi:MAG: inositol monophosphatase family protein [Nocardioidaceae bacterium]